MIPFKCDDFEVLVPGRWGDVTLGQFYELKNGDGSESKAISVLTGISQEALLMCKDIDIKEKFGPYTEFLQDASEIGSWFLNDFITISGKKYPKPKGIGINTAGQKWHLEDAWKEADKEGKSDVDCFAIALAIYMQPIVTGKAYDADLVEKLVPEILNCKLEEAWPLASFFLKNYVDSLSKKERLYHINQSQKRYEQGLTASRSSETLQQFSAWRRFWVKVLKKLSSRITTLYTPLYTSRLSKVDTETV